MKPVLALLILGVAVCADETAEESRTRPLPPRSHPPAGPTVKLGSYRVHADKITVSGFSSGGSMAQQLQISHSSLFSGIAVFSHTYYRCGPGNAIEMEYDNACTTLGGPNSRLWDPERARRDIEQYARQGLIDNTSNLQNKKLYVYTGTHNWLFTTDQSLRIVNIYEPLIRNPAAIMTRVQAANLTLPSDTFGGSCAADSTTNFLISNCGLSGPHEALRFILGDFVRKPDPQRRVNLQPLQMFDQRDFFEANTRPGMDDVGFLYVPQYCRGGYNRCYLHFYFHGCSLGREFVSDNHIRRSGYLELAEENGIIMVFPQAQKMLPENEIGCWDTYGLTSTLYATQRGLQVAVVRRMITQILKPTFQNSASSGYGGSRGSGTTNAANSFTTRRNTGNSYTGNSYTGNSYTGNSYSYAFQSYNPVPVSSNDVQTRGYQGSRVRWTRYDPWTELVLPLFTRPELFAFLAISQIL